MLDNCAVADVSEAAPLSIGGILESEGSRVSECLRSELNAFDWLARTGLSLEVQ